MNFARVLFFFFYAFKCLISECFEGKKISVCFRFLTLFLYILNQHFFWLNVLIFLWFCFWDAFVNLLLKCLSASNFVLNYFVLNQTTLCHHYGRFTSHFKFFFSPLNNGSNLKIIIITSFAPHLTCWASTSLQ